MQSLLNTARNIRNNANATQTAIDEAAIDLWDAIERLERVPVVAELIWTELEDAIREAELRMQSNYTPQSWSQMQSHLNGARGVRNNPNTSTQFAIDAAVNHLRDAIDALEERVIIELIWAELENTIREAELRVQSNYTPRSWMTMQSHLNGARGVRNNPNTSTQFAIDAAVNHLRDAIDALEER